MFKVNKGSGKRPYGYAGKCISWYIALINTSHGARDGHVERAISHSSEKFAFFIFLMCPREDWFFSAWLWTLEFLSLHVPLTFRLWFSHCPGVTDAALGTVTCKAAFLGCFFFPPMFRKPIALHPPYVPVPIFSVSPVSCSSVWGSDVVPHVQPDSTPLPSRTF